MVNQHNLVLYRFTKVKWFLYIEYKMLSKKQTHWKNKKMCCVHRWKSKHHKYINFKVTTNSLLINNLKISHTNFQNTDSKFHIAE